MFHRKFSHLLASLPALSPDQMRLLARELERRMDAIDKGIALTTADPGPDSARNERETADQEIQRRLFDAGLLSEIKPPIRDLTPYQNRLAVPIKGEPLSETVIRDRR